VVRSGPAFALSLVLSSVEPALRSAAELGAWQIISPVSVTGRVVEVQGLHEVQDTVRAALKLPQPPTPTQTLVQP
jgi:alpha-glucan,water dikinase